MHYFVSLYILVVATSLSILLKLTLIFVPLQQVALKERNKLKRESAANFDTVGDADKLLQQKDEEVRFGGYAKKICSLLYLNVSSIRYSNNIQFLRTVHNITK